MLRTDCTLDANDRADTEHHGKISDFGQHSDPEVARWNLLQKLQVDFCWTLELPYYYRSESWRQARRVVDVGCGVGYYLNRIAARFPAKSYLGIDVSKPFIDLAKADTVGQGLEFEVCSVDELAGTYDFAIARLVFQHLTDPWQALERIRSVLRPGGSLMIIDARDELRFYEPDFSAFTSFFDAFVASQQHEGLDRDFAANLVQRREKNSNWSCLGNWEVLIPSTIPGNSERFQRIYAELIDFVEESGSFAFDYAGLRQAWRQWWQHPMPYTHAGLSIVLLQNQG